MLGQVNGGRSRRVTTFPSREWRGAGSPICAGPALVERFHGHRLTVSDVPDREPTIANQPDSGTAWDPGIRAFSQFADDEGES